jgi:hypothetical protein
MSLVLKKRVTKKIDNSHIVWFEESNSWIQLEEPAWFVYRNYLSGILTKDISQKFSKKYGLNVSESLILVGEIIKKIKTLSSSSFHTQEVYSADKYTSPDNFFSNRDYIIKNKVFRICYQSRNLEYIIHPCLAHLEVKYKAKTHFILQIFSYSSSLILKSEIKTWVENDANLLKRRLFIEIAGLLYEKSDDGWLAFVHASAVSNGKESIILTTSSGSGKSTLAALLCKKGLKFVSDDYVPVDARYCKAYPFPAALSVKDGAWPVLLPYYDQLRSAEVFHFKGTNKTLRYLAFPCEKDFYKPVPVKTLVFVQYDPSTTSSIHRVPVLEALRRFNEEAWVSAHLPNARKFINWFAGLECYSLKYSENEAAITKILKLFQKN